MELWIRSQDRLRLVKTTDICIDYNNQKSLIANCRILSNGKDDYFPLGEYDTEERALAVLDEIQNFICIEIHENNLDYEKADLILKGKIVDSLCKIYQMPKE